jgi:hypothetical protein
MQADNIQLAVAAKADKILDSQVIIRGQVTTWRKWVQGLDDINFQTSDAMIDYSRIKFNRMNLIQQKEYMNSLKSKVYYWVDDIKVSKTVYNYAVWLKQNSKNPIE